MVTIHSYSLHFDDGLYPSQYYAFQVSDNAQATALVPQHTSVHQSDPLQFDPESMSCNPSVPANDKESLESPQAAFWEAARQEELRSCALNKVWSEPMVLPPGKKAINMCWIRICY